MKKYDGEERRTGRLKDTILDILRDIADGRFLLIPEKIKNLFIPGFKGLSTALYHEVESRLGSKADEVLGEKRFANMFRELHAMTKTTPPENPLRRIVNEIYYDSDLETQKHHYSRRNEPYF